MRRQVTPIYENDESNEPIGFIVKMVEETPESERPKVIIDAK